MTSLPLSSNRTASEHSSPRLNHLTHPTDVSNSPHLQVLGRNGRDLPLFEHDNRTTATSTSPVNTAATTTATAAPPPSTSKHWWNNVWNAHKKEEELTPTYASLDGETQVETAATTAVTPFASSLTTTTTTATSSTLSAAVAVQALLMEPTTRTLSPTTSTDATSSHYTNATLSSSSSPQTNKDLIRQDCSFFYRDVDEVSPRGRRTPRSTLPPRQQSAYRIRYQQLNQDNGRRMQNDLEFYELEEQVHDAPQKYPRMCSDLTNHSSLHYKQNDRVLMKLPKDKVRLVMDPELGQAGILSAIVNKEEDISYILTVSPDLYRKVVLDLGPTSCLWATDDRVSMHIAVLLLIGILLTLFVFTLMYPGD